VRYLANGRPDYIRRRLPWWHQVFTVLLLATLLIPFINLIFLVPTVSAHGSKNDIEKLKRIALFQNQDLAMDIAMAENEQYNRKKS